MPDIPSCLLSLLLSMSLVAVYGAAASRFERFGVLFPAVIIAMLTAVSILCSSRTCFVSTIVGISYLLIERKRAGKKSFLILMLIAILLPAALYFLRPESANGRVLIWMVCLSMIKDQPWGYGISGLANNYMLYQAEFFRLHPDSAFAWYADNIAIPFNEFLHIAVNLGLVGLLFCLLMIGDVLFTRDDSWKNTVLKGMFLTYLIFSMFSFPLSNLYTWTALFALLITLKKKYAAKAVNIFSVIAIAAGLFYFCVEDQCECIIEDFHLNGVVDEETLQKMCMTPYLFAIYPTLGDMLLHVDGIESSRCYGSLVDVVSHRIPNTEVYCKKGDILLSERNLDQALAYYQEASYMVPLKLVPKYKEFLLYVGTGDFKNATHIGRKILDSEIKVHSSEAILIKESVRKQMNGFQNE